jgi:Zn-dependent protease with chaperone function
MDFFQAQEGAARRTRVLVALFALAVIAIVVVIYLPVAFVLTGGRFDPRHFAIVAGCVGTVVGGGSVYMIQLLGRDGASVARRLGGRHVPMDTTDPVERRFQNVVEEMAIASGIPVPSVFVLDYEQGINAFAAGMEPGSAAVAVTRGALNHLTREELQGVVAHEIAHILSGDMRLNLRLAGLVHGLLLLAIIGRGVLRAGGHSGGGRRGGGAKVVALGAVLVAVGYTGVLAGRLIKAAISRQREFAADAAAMQFTRSRDGIGGALKKILGALGGAELWHPRAEEASHMFIANALKSPLVSWTATHPPLEERIRRLDPGFRYEDVPVIMTAPSGPHQREGMGIAAAQGLAGADAGGPGHPGAPRGGSEGPRPSTVSPVQAVSSIGNPDSAHLLFAAHVLSSTPPSLMEAAHRPLGAEPVIYALLLDRAPEVRERQLERVRASARPEVAAEAERLAPEASALPRRHRLPLVDVAIASLRDRSEGDRAATVACARALAEADGRLDFSEVLLAAILDRHLLHGHEPDVVRHRDAEAVAAQLSLLFGLLARSGSPRAEAAELAYGSGIALFPRGVLPADLPPPADLLGLDQALGELASTSPELKRRVIRAAAEVVLSDAEVSETEAELLRLVADRLGCPMPPLRVTGPISAPA